MKKFISMLLITFVISGMINVATIQEVMAGSPTIMGQTLSDMKNYIANNGNLSVDQNNDKIADGWSMPANSSVQLNGNVQAVKYGEADSTVRYIIEDTAQNTTGKDKYYMGLWIKTTAPDVRFYMTQKSGTTVTYPSVSLSNQNGEWQYYSMLVDLTGTTNGYLHGLYIKDRKAEGQVIEYKEVHLYNLTQEFGSTTPSQADMDAFVKASSAYVEPAPAPAPAPVPEPVPTPEPVPVPAPVVVAPVVTKTFTNLMVNNGTFTVDTDKDGMADGWSKPSNATTTMANGIQSIKFGVANSTSRYLVDGVAMNTTGKDKYYLSMWIKTTAPDVRFYVAKKVGTTTTFPKVILGNQNGEWQYYSMLVDLSDSALASIHSIYIKDGKANGSPVLVKDVKLLNLTKEYGLGKELSASEVDAILNPSGGTQVVTAPPTVEEEVVVEEPVIVAPVVKGQSVVKYGAVADANYFNPSTGSYYKDSAFKTLATDNQVAFQTAFDSGSDLYIPAGNYYISERVNVLKGIDVVADGAVIFTKSSPTIKYLFRIVADNVKISGMTIKTTLDRKPLINGLEESGLGSNVYAFVVQSSNVTIDNATTYNVCRGVHANKTVNSMKNLTITNSNFYDATIPVFIMYTDGIIIDNSTLESNGSGLSAGLHSLYFGTQTYNAVVSNSKIKFKSVNNGGILQFFSSKFSAVSIANILIKDTLIETNGTHLMVLGEVKNLVLDNITFVKNNPSPTNKAAVGKLIFAHNYVYDVTIQNSNIIMADAASIINGKGTNYGNIVLKNNTLTTTLGTSASLFSTVMGTKLEGNTIKLLPSSAGIFFGFGGTGTIEASNNKIISEAPYMLLGSGNSGSAGTLKLNSNIFTFSNTKLGVAFYNNTTNMPIQAIGNTFTGFTKLASNTAGTVNTNNLFK